jgi:hypothetical protein
MWRGRRPGVDPRSAVPPWRGGREPLVALVAPASAGARNGGFAYVRCPMCPARLVSGNTDSASENRCLLRLLDPLDPDWCFQGRACGLSVSGCWIQKSLLVVGDHDPRPRVGMDVFAAFRIGDRCWQRARTSSTVVHRRYDFLSARSWCIRGDTAAPVASRLPNASIAQVGEDHRRLPLNFRMARRETRRLSNVSDR